MADCPFNWGLYYTSLLAPFPRGVYTTKRNVLFPPSLLPRFFPPSLWGCRRFKSLSIYSGKTIPTGCLYLSEILLSAVEIVFYPRHDRGEDILLGTNVQIITRDQILNLLQGQQEEFLGLCHFVKVLQGVLVRSVLQLFTSVCVREATDAQAIGRVQLSEKKLATRFPYARDL